jgi:hypothetical protein
MGILKAFAAFEDITKLVLAKSNLHRRGKYQLS